MNCQIIKQDVGSLARALIVLFCAGVAGGQVLGRDVNLCYPGETIELELKVRSTQDCDLVVSDWHDKTVLRRAYDPKSQGKVTLTAEDVGAFGAFQVAVVERGSTNAPLAKTWFARLSSRTVEPVEWIGTHAHVVRRKCYYDGRFLEMLSAAGVGYVRVDYSWHGIETEKGQYRDAVATDRWIDRFGERGIGAVVLLSLWQVPECYADKKDTSGFPAFCAYAARHLKGRKCIFEIYNEPQNTAYRRLFAEEEKATKPWDCWLYPLMETAKKSAAAIHEADPEARVYVTGEDVEPLLVKMIESGVATEKEGISFHPYGHKNPYPERIYWFRDNGAEIRALAKAHGGATRFCITETGIPTLLEEGHRHHSVAGDFVCTTVEHQAAYITRLFLLSRLSGVDLMCQYNWMNEGTDIHYTENNFGQLFNDCTPKPSFAATAQLARMLGKAQVVGEKSPDPSQWRLAEFRRDEKNGSRRVFAVWSIERRLEVDFPQDFEGAAFVDLMGNKMAAPKTENGKLVVETFPYYVVCKRK